MRYGCGCEAIVAGIWLSVTCGVYGQANDFAAVIGFAGNGTKNPDAVVVVNIGEKNKQIALKVSGSASRMFEAYRTTDEKDERQTDFRHGFTRSTNSGQALIDTVSGVLTQFTHYALPGFAVASETRFTRHDSRDTRYESIVFESPHPLRPVFEPDAAGLCPGAGGVVLPMPLERP